MVSVFVVLSLYVLLKTEWTTLAQKALYCYIGRFSGRKSLLGTWCIRLQLWRAFLGLWPLWVQKTLILGWLEKLSGRVGLGR